MQGRVFNHWRHIASKRFLIGAISLPLFYKTAQCDSPDVDLDRIMNRGLKKESERLEKAEKIALEAIKRAIRNLSTKEVRDTFKPLIDKAISEGTLRISQEINREILGLRSHIQREVQAHAAGQVPKAIDRFIHQHEKVDAIMKKHTAQLERAIDKEARTILDRIIQEEKYQEINQALIRDFEVKNEENIWKHIYTSAIISGGVSAVVAFLLGRYSSSGSGESRI